MNNPSASSIQKRHFSKKRSALRRLWLREPCHSENKLFVEEMCYLYRRTRLTAAPCRRDCFFSGEGGRAVGVFTHGMTLSRSAVDPSYLFLDVVLVCRRRTAVYIYVCTLGMRTVSRKDPRGWQPVDEVFHRNTGHTAIFSRSS